ncbi:hypothetical protein ACH5RR_006804 [Cinchona calisaya]|uniref:Uncharacterized protein n=1 Tax=Cinchona calisaya TaxID=153742 RepID=A0ABD3AQC4_9GENT
MPFQNFHMTSINKPASFQIAPKIICFNDKLHQNMCIIQKAQSEFPLVRKRSRKGVMLGLPRLNFPMRANQRGLDTSSTSSFENFKASSPLYFSKGLRSSSESSKAIESVLSASANDFKMQPWNTTRIKEEKRMNSESRVRI